MHGRHILEDSITCVRFDVKEDCIVVSVAEGGPRGDVREYARIANTPAALRRVARRLAQEGVDLRLCYVRLPTTSAERSD
jgi:hypothetical protein